MELQSEVSYNVTSLLRALETVTSQHQDHSQHEYCVFTIFFQTASGYSSDLGIMVNDDLM